MTRKAKYITSPQTKVIDNENFDSLISVVLFAENHGYRMKSYGPISLMKIEGKTLIERQIDTIKATFKNFEIILCVGFETQKIVEFVKDNFTDINIRVVENQMHFTSNCCESARLCLSNINNDKILFCNGGVLITPECLRSINYNENSIIFQEEDEHKDFNIGAIHDAGDRLVSLGLGVKKSVWSEILYLSRKKAVKSMYSIMSNPEYKNRFMFEAINELMEHNEVIFAIEPKGVPIIKINNIKTLKRITKI